jgi:hypothetical protein
MKVIASVPQSSVQLIRDFTARKAGTYGITLLSARTAAHEPRLPPHYRPTRSKIIRARFTLSDTTAVKRGDGWLISGSRARRTAAMMAAAMTNVEFIRACSRIFSAQASRSRAIARFISPIRAPLIARLWGQVCTRPCLERSRLEDSSSSRRRADTVR